MTFLAFKSRDIKQMIKECFPFLLKDHSFKFESSDTLIRVSEYVLQGICFEHSQYSRKVTVTPFIWPLIVPISFVPLTIGRRLQNKTDKSGFGGWFEFDSGLEATVASIREIGELLREVAIPFLDDSSSIVAIAENSYQMMWSTFWTEAVSIDYNRCFMYAFTGQKSLFHEVFTKIEPIFEKDDRDWAIQEFHRLVLLRQNLDNPQALAAMFREYILFCIANLKLDKFNIQLP